jgi:hypothetical protein
MQMLIEQLYNRFQQKGESVREYYLGITDLCHRVDSRMADTEKGMQFLRGLDTNVKQFVLAGTVGNATLQQLYSAALRVEPSSSTGRPWMPNNVAATPTVISVNDTLIDQVSQLSATVAALTETINRQSNSTYQHPTQKQHHNQEVRPWYETNAPYGFSDRSHEYSTVSRRFGVKRNYAWTTDGQPVCVRCNRVGHISSLCPDSENHQFNHDAKTSHLDNRANKWVRQGDAPASPSIADNRPF